MKKTVLTFLVIFLTINLLAQWKPAGDKIKTQWGENLDPTNVLQEYPRPIMERNEWLNLNGLWDMSIRPVEENTPADFNEKILVPFPLESSLSGQQKRIDEKHAIWYRRTVKIPSSWNNRRILLHFGAADWQTEVFINGIKIGSHRGGYTPFSFDITPFLKKGEQTLTVKVWDPTDKYYQPRGKQVSKPDNIVYTPSSGIWQTVWLEPVADAHIEGLKILPNIDKSQVGITIENKNFAPSDYYQIQIFDNKSLIVDVKTASASPVDISVPNPNLWSPDSPFLYDLQITLFRNGKQTDKVKSYFAMRKISVKRDKNGIMRMQLNNKDLVHIGLLDQGFWPDGLYTAPSDEALKFDIEEAKRLGYNTLRKHIKVEPARWYTWCDRLGMLVWQDMPSGDNNWKFDSERSPFWDTSIEKKPNEAHENFFREWTEIIDYLYSYPSIVMWIPFNEGWGQFRTQEVADLTRRCDPSRLMNVASGWHHIQDGDVNDQHNYPEPKITLYDAARANVLGEYGGIGVVEKGHTWNDTIFDYVRSNSSKEATDKYIEYAGALKQQIKQGFCGAIYTQWTDVEGEANGIYTYDRKVLKFDADRIRKANKELINALP